MNLYKIVFLSLLISFHIINGAIKINNFDKVIIAEGTTEYFEYDFVEPNLQEGKAPFFFFQFNNVNYEILIRYKGRPPFDPYDINSNTLCYIYEIKKLISQKYYFIIRNINSHSSLSTNEELTMVFLDNSKEINTNLDKLIDLNLTPRIIYREKPILPFVFNLELIEEKTILKMDLDYQEDSFEDYDGNSLVEYCIINNTQCSYNSTGHKLILERGNNYRIKFNWLLSNNVNYYYYSINKIGNIIKEVNFGFHEYILDYSRNYSILFDATNIDKFYLYLKPYNGLKTLFITQNEKESLENNENLYKEFNDNSEYHSNEINEIFVEQNKKYFLLSNNNKQNSEKVIIYFFNYKIEIQNEKIFEMENGTYGLLYRNYSEDINQKYIIVSTDKTMAIFNSNFNKKELSYLIYIDKNIDDYNNENQNLLIYVDSSKGKSKYKIYNDSIPKYMNDLNLITERNLTSSFKNYGSDSLFMRTSFSHLDYNFYNKFFFGIAEKYYLYIRKYFGVFDFYKYNKEIDIFSDIKINYNDYEIINSSLIIVSGFQIYSFCNSYGSLYDLYFEKVNDNDLIQSNSQMYQFSNIVKLLEENKTYLLNFEVDHLIKLDKQFLDAEVVFTKNENLKFYLNKANQTLKNLVGSIVTVQSDKPALIYFYKKFDQNNNLEVIEFNKNESSKNMKFNITNIEGGNINILIAKDFCFKGYYPMLGNESFIKINNPSKSATIYIENLYDYLSTELNEEEQYFIYLMDNSVPKQNFSKKYNISPLIYYDNLLTPGNPHNFEIIPPKTNGSIILSLNKKIIQYKLFTCQNNKIKFKIDQSSKPKINNEYTYEKEINKANEKDIIYFYLNETDILSHSFDSEKELLFTYTFKNSYLYCDNKLDNYTILSIDEISKNLLKIEFSPIYINCNSRYYIIISMKDKNNLSDECDISKIIISNNSSDLIIESFLNEKTNENIPLISIINITDLNTEENNKLVITILGYNSFDLYKPKEFTLQNKKPIEFEIGEEVEFNFTNEKIVFKFEYLHKTNLPQIIYFNFRQNIDFNIIFIDNKKPKIIELHGEEELINITLQNSGTYYLEFYSYKSIQIIGKFISFISGNLIDTIDLTQKMYYGNKTIKLKNYLGYNVYQVSNITKDTFVYFIYYVQNEDKKEFENPFEICNINNKCDNNKTLFKFIKGNNYTIKINFINKEDDDTFYYPSYVFFPIFEDTIEIKEEGFYFIQKPKIYIVNLTNKDKLFLYYEFANKIYFTYSNENIQNNENIINNLNFVEISDLESISNNKNNYGIITIIPFMNKYTTKFIIADLLIDTIDNIGEYNISSGKNALIFLKNTNLEFIDKQGDSNDDKNEFVYNILTTFSSEEKCMNLIREDINKKYDFISQNSYPFPIYVNKSDNDIKIKIKTYNQRYSLFGAINNNLFENYINFFLKKANSREQELFNFQQFPLYLRINSDYFNFNEFFNLYLYESEANIYFKNYYGETDFYEFTDYIDKNDLSVITKPIYYSKNNKSILNKLLNLTGTKLIAGHLEHNTFLDLYIDLNDDSTDIKIIPFEHGMNRNTAKFLKKDIKYKLDFAANHLIKLEPGFNSNISIYNESKNYTLSPENPTVKIQGLNFYIISNNDTLVYFYGKLFGNFKQYKIEPEEGQNIEIKINSSINCAIDFGFEGYFLNDFISLSFLSFSEGSIFYMENIYEKLKPNLVEGENLYLYYISSDEDYPFEINYIPNINNPKNEYTFNVISTNDKNKSLIINNYHFEEILFQINSCSSNSLNVKINYHSAESYNETIFEFNNEKKEEIIHDLKKYPFKLSFESNEDFIFSYSFFDKGDSLYFKKEKWPKDRIVLENLSINVTNYLGIISIFFEPNYKASSTRYTIVIAPLNESNIKENYYPCFITKLLTDKNEDIKIINLVDIGENDYINASNIDIFDLLNYNNSKFIIDIISQELRFDKKINFYNPFVFNQIKYQIEFEKEQNFNLDESIFYYLKYEKNSENNEIFLLNYNLEQETSMKIKVISEINNEQIININDKNGYVYFPCDKNGHYRIQFEKRSIANLRSINSIDAGSFKIISAEKPFNIDIKNANLVFNEFNITRIENDSVSLKLNIDSLDKDYTKKISIGNINLNSLNEVILIQKNNEGYIPLNFPYYTFEKDIAYNITINFAKKEGNTYTLEKTNIIDFSSKNIIEFSEDNIINKIYNFSDIDDKFMIINWTKLESISINIKKNNATIFLSELSESQSKNFNKEFQNLNFKNIINSNVINITKPLDSNYSVLYIVLYLNETEIEFNAISNWKEKEDEDDKEDEEEEKKEDKEKEDKGDKEVEEEEDKEDTEYKKDKEENNDKDDTNDKGGLSTIVIVFISIFGIIFIFVIIFFILRYCRKKNDIDFQFVTKTLDSELLFLDNDN